MHRSHISFDPKNDGPGSRSRATGAPRLKNYRFARDSFGALRSRGGYRRGAPRTGVFSQRISLSYGHAASGDNDKGGGPEVRKYNYGVAYRRPGIRPLLHARRNLTPAAL